VPDRRLVGVRVLITRPAHQAEPLAQLIEAEGGEAIRLPTIEIAEPQDPAAAEQALRTLPHAGLAIFISPNAVVHGLARLRAGGGWPPTMRFAAVGAGTAHALQAAGIREVIVPGERFNSEALLDCLPAESLRGETVLLFRGEGGREHLAASLHERGARVEHVVCYRRSLPRHPDTTSLARLARGDIHLVVITSVEGLRNLLVLAGDTARTPLLATPLMVMSERQAQAARELGFHGVVIVAPRADDRVVLDTVIAWQETRKTL
jgi:uroporphyrinogen-III synthase